MRIVSWNVNGIRACYKKNLMGFIQMETPDVLCLQETKALIEQVDEPVKLLGYDKSYWMSAKRKGYSGVATFSNIPPVEVKHGIGIAEYDSEGRVLITSYEKFDIYNIYFPNGGSGDERHLFKQNFLKDLYHLLKNELSRGKEIIVVGDYNIAHQEIDIFDPIKFVKESGFLPEERTWFDRFIELGFVDSFRELNPNLKNKYSWWSYREFSRVGNRGWRIDYICLSKGLRKYLKSADILDHVDGSDHCPVRADFEF